MINEIDYLNGIEGNQQFSRVLTRETIKSVIGIMIRGRLLVHEYGHTYQSLLLGPLYFVIVGIPSVIWGMVKKPGQSYFSFYAEKWANHLGEKFTGCKSMEMIDI